AFYALGDARTPMMVSLLSIVINFVMNWMLVGVLQERGLALSTSAVALLNFGLLYFIMGRRIRGVEGRETAAEVAKILIASAVMAVVCWLTSSGLERAAGDGHAARMINVPASIGAGAASFYLTASLLKVEELNTATRAITARFKRLARR
ncbi:MAG TPA: lipid II flippase MurJ, partial [Blastocatellia bacterium]|nr:lipid II flippase MurJ [Blastocatellia bacterium]